MAFKNRVTFELNWPLSEVAEAEPHAADVCCYIVYIVYCAEFSFVAVNNCRCIVFASFVA